MNEKFLNNLLNSISVSGYEEQVQDIVTEEMKEYTDEIRRDEMQNLTCILNPENDVRIMLSAHADEIGLMISNIREDGRLQVIDRGGIVPATYPGRQVRIKTKNGEVYGVVEAYRDLFKEENLGTKHFLIDIGAKDREDALKNVSLGDPIVPDTHIRKMTNGKFTPEHWMTDLVFISLWKQSRERKSLDVKLVSMELLQLERRQRKPELSGQVHGLIRHLPIVVDVTYTSDCSGMDPAEMGTVLLGGGPVLCNSPIVVKTLNAKMEECAKKVGIPVQREAASRLSYTDGDKIHFSNQGVPMVLVSIPLRYMHMPAEVADEKDVEGCVELIAQFLANYNA